VKVEQTDCMYRPRVQGVVAGQTVQIHNGDQTLHNVHTYAGTKTLFNMAQPPIAGAKPITKTFKDETPLIAFKCDVHPWMRGYVAVSTHPFFAVTDDKGSFALKGVPPGAYTVEAWHERFGTKATEVKVEAGKPATASFAYTGAETKTN